MPREKQRRARGETVEGKTIMERDMILMVG
jgi:hypothetical protein